MFCALWMFILSTTKFLFKKSHRGDFISTQVPPEGLVKFIQIWSFCFRGNFECRVKGDVCLSTLRSVNKWTGCRLKNGSWPEMDPGRTQQHGTNQQFAFAAVTNRQKELRGAHQQLPVRNVRVDSRPFHLFVLHPICSHLSNQLATLADLYKDIAKNSQNVSEFTTEFKVIIHQSVALWMFYNFAFDAKVIKRRI
jgi:hypothetical protein